MTLRELEQRVAQLESALSRLQLQVDSSKAERKPGWKRSLEKFAGDEDLLSILADAMKLREAERRKARGGKPKSQKQP